MMSIWFAFFFARCNWIISHLICISILIDVFFTCTFRIMFDVFNWRNCLSSLHHVVRSCWSRCIAASGSLTVCTAVEERPWPRRWRGQIFASDVCFPRFVSSIRAFFLCCSGFERMSTRLCGVKPWLPTISILLCLRSRAWLGLWRWGGRNVKPESSTNEVVFLPFPSERPLVSNRVCRTSVWAASSPPTCGAWRARGWSGERSWESGASRQPGGTPSGTVSC